MKVGTSLNRVRSAVLPTCLHPLDGVDLERIGPAGDGGYVIARNAIDKSRYLLSLGLGDDWRFEAEFQRRSGARLLVLDHTVTPRFWFNHELRRVTNMLGVASVESSATFNRSASYLHCRRFFALSGRQHLRKAVGYGTEGTVSVADLLADKTRGDTFVKMDIEGHEWRTLPELLAYEDRLSGLVAEFHDVDLNLDRLVEFVSALSNLVIVDVSVNNYGLIAPDGTPSLVEVSFAPRSVTGITDDHWTTIPRRNVPNKPPVSLTFS